MTSFVVHLAVALTAVLLIAFTSRAIARTLRQPSVVGEIAAGLLCAPAIVAVAGQAGLDFVWSRCSPRAAPPPST